MTSVEAMNAVRKAFDNPDNQDVKLLLHAFCEVEETFGRTEALCALLLEHRIASRRLHYQDLRDAERAPNPQTGARP